jgi:spore coat protein A, manganese oxidase
MKRRRFTVLGIACMSLTLVLALLLVGGERARTGGVASPDQEELDPLDIPKFAHELPIPRVFAPNVIRDSSGRVIRHEYTISVAHAQVQMLPPGFPTTTARAFGGRVKIPGSSQTEFIRSVPGSVFENTRGIPALVRWRDEIFQPTFFPVDPVLHWANPNAFEPPTPPFTPFPPGYEAAQFPVAHVTHTHGLVVKPHFDGTAEEWFTPFGQRAPSFVSRDYDMPNEQPSTQLFYHDHVVGVTRVGVHAGSVGAAYFIRDPNDPLDRSSSPLPRGQFEIPLVFFNRAFFTDGEMNFPRESDDTDLLPYWQAEDESDTSLVNGKVWPNLNVQRRQYRFRMLAADNVRVYNFRFDHNGTFVPFTIVGSDGGYLPAPQVVDELTLGITERADVLFDFSRFAPGTRIILRNTTPGINTETTGVLMRFTVLNSAAVAPPPLSPSLFPPRPALPTNAPARIKTLIRFRDSAETNRQRSLDGLQFDRPPTEFPLVGSTEEWVLVHTGEEEEAEPGEEPDADLGTHMIHLHLIEFQVLNRQRFDRTAYLQQWSFLNGHRPVTRQIPLDPTPYLIGEPEPPLPYETGWKDTVRTPPEVVTRIRARWAPQEVPTGGVSPGQNLFPFDPTVFPTSTDTFTGPGYVWHCHLLGHEDHDMMRPMPLVARWRTGVSYPVGRVVAFNNINYRVRQAHASQSDWAPPNVPALWERVNNNDGTWRRQIIYAVGDRVLHNGQLFKALQAHQAQTGAEPSATPALWRPLPMTACGQLAEFCADDTGNADGAACFALGQAGDEAACRGEEAEDLMRCLSVCEPVHATPCSGLCNNPVQFSVPDGTTFRSGPLGSGATCHETTSELLNVACSAGSGRRLTINGRRTTCDGQPKYPLPPQRDHGYCIQTDASGAAASFTAR